MDFILPISNQSCVLRDFIPHKVVAAYNEAMYRGVQIKPGTVSATKEELLKEFGAEVMRALDELKEAEYDKRLAELREEFLRRNVEMEGMSLGNVEAANMRKVEGMVLSLSGAQASRALIEDLPHDDYELILEKIQEIADATSKKKASARSAS